MKLNSNRAATIAFGLCFTLALGLIARGQQISGGGALTSLINGAASLTLNSTTGGITLTDSGGSTVQLQPSVAGAALLTTSSTQVGMTAAFGLELLSNSARLSLGASSDLILSRNAAAVLQIGLDSATPIAQSFRVANSRSGTDTNVGGANLTLMAGAGTGTGTPSSLILQSPVAVGSGTGAQTQTTGLAIKNGTAITTGYTVSTLPSAHVSGARAHVTDQTTTCAAPGAALTGGGAVTCPVFDNGTTWVGG